MAFQTLDLAEAMQRDGAGQLKTIRIDGGMSANDWFCQFLADMLQAEVERPACLETTSMGAAFLAGLAVGVWKDLDEVAATWKRGAVFEPRMDGEQRARMIAGWKDALKRTLPAK